jgi:response regulator of citrate/malate metabolism
MEVLKQIRRSDPRSFVVMVSAFGVVKKVQEAVALGVGGFVVKPYSARRIADVLQKYVAETSDSGLLRVDS